jgi:hypothetical protein
MKLEDLKVASYILYVPDFLDRLDTLSETITLERRGQREGADKWGIYKSSSVLYKSEKRFGYEGMPSSRTNEHLADTRFNSAQEALDFWQECQPAHDKELRDRLDMMKQAVQSRKNKKD